MDCLVDCITYSVICFQIINLFPEKDRPQIFAEKLDHVEVIGESGAISGESVNWVGVSQLQYTYPVSNRQQDGLRTTGKTAEIF